MTLNNSGFKALGNRVILREDTIGESAGGIILPNGQKMPYKLLVDIGEDAFKDYTVKPKIGQKVLHTTAYPLGVVGPDDESYFVTEEENLLVVEA